MFLGLALLLLVSVPYCPQDHDRYDLPVDYGYEFGDD